ncbi:cytochrome b/b6 domain-containing protein [Gulosibacter chungangensis]|uniref:Cytochrome b/b6 domain-containing protein n=1 Tax=Gulosibacter chungangensis TaxID=979746 RepID=A0A7J5BFT6_9MICO|nr:cytochrome b/b6 domain-containing protein [Gulosibacter chungangensis]KAB1645115.1 cytochrome b/b6 domain-containing protein [Gulosibacter chungangensis]
MATYTGRIRRGLPRDRNGEPWPPVEQAPLEPNAIDEPVASAWTSPSTDVPATHDAPQQDAVAVAAPEDHGSAPAAAVPDEAAASEAGEVFEPVVSEDGAEVVRAAEAVLAEHRNATASTESKREMPLRRGLPRVSGGEAWPPAGTVTVDAGAAPKSGGPQVAAGSDSASGSNAGSPVAAASEDAAKAASAARSEQTSDVAATSATATSPGEDSAAPTSSAASPASSGSGTGAPLRRGLPRVAGGEAWPPVGFAPAPAPAPAPPAKPEPVAAEPKVSPASTPAAPVTSTPAVASASSPAPVAKPATASPKAAPAAAKSKPAVTKQKTAKPEPKRYGGRTVGGWIRFGLLWVVGAAAAAGIIVLAARGLTTFSAVQNFMARYPAEYELPATAEPGFPAWVRWSHFLNMFFIVLIIRSGLLVRRQQKPPAFWTPKNGKGAKISINLWLHQSLDLLWLINGIVFVVLLFVTGHWMRIVPTSWEVFPNALSAMIQYLTLEWPVEDGWVNYNSLQQLMYFLVVFVAAPLAAITGARLSDMWPKKAARLNKLYPVELARALHFPTMLFFVLFVIVHVVLVFSTGALKNLNHMYAGTPEISWVGFWLFVGSILAVAAVWAASKPMILAPIANLFGKVSSR